MDKLLAASPVDASEIIVVLDNHTAHRSHLIRDFTQGKGLTLLFLPAYSSSLNPIERLWALVKHKWAKQLAGLTRTYNNSQMQGDLSRMFEEAAHQFTFRILDQSNTAMRKALNYQLV